MSLGWKLSKLTDGLKKKKKKYAIPFGATRAEITNFTFKSYENKSISSPVNTKLREVTKNL